MANVIDTVSVQNLLASYCDVFGKETFFPLGGLGK